MKIDDIVIENTDQVKQDASKVSDLIKSNQSVNIAVDTYVNIHSGKLDYDAAYSKASQKAFGQRVTKSGEAPDPKDVERLKTAEIDRLVKAQQQKAKSDAEKSKQKIDKEKETAADRRKASARQTIFDPVTGEPRALDKQYSPNFRGNQYTGGIPSGIKALGQRFARDPAGTILNPFGTTDVDSSLRQGAEFGTKLFSPRTGSRTKSNLTLRRS